MYCSQNVPAITYHSESQNFDSQNSAVHGSFLSDSLSQLSELSNSDSITLPSSLNSSQLSQNMDPPSSTSQGFRNQVERSRNPTRKNGFKSNLNTCMLSRRPRSNSSGFVSAAGPVDFFDCGTNNDDGNLVFNNTSRIDSLSCWIDTNERKMQNVVSSELSKHLEELKIRLSEIKNATARVNAPLDELKTMVEELTHGSKVAHKKQLKEIENLNSDLNTVITKLDAFKKEAAKSNKDGQVKTSNEIKILLKKLDDIFDKIQESIKKPTLTHEIGCQIEPREMSNASTSPVFPLPKMANAETSPRFVPPEMTCRQTSPIFASPKMRSCQTSPILASPKTTCRQTSPIFAPPKMRSSQTSPIFASPKMKSCQTYPLLASREVRSTQTSPILASTEMTNTPTSPAIATSDVTNIYRPTAFVSSQGLHSKPVGVHRLNIMKDDDGDWLYEINEPMDTNINEDYLVDLTGSQDSIEKDFGGQEYFVDLIGSQEASEEDPCDWYERPPRSVSITEEKDDWY